MGGHKLLYLIHTAGIVLIPSIYPAVARDVEYIYIYIVPFCTFTTKKENIHRLYKVYSWKSDNSHFNRSNR